MCDKEALQNFAAQKPSPQREAKIAAAKPSPQREAKRRGEKDFFSFFFLLFDAPPYYTYKYIDA